MKDMSYYAVQLIAKSNDPSVKDVRFGTGCILRYTGASSFHYILISNRHVIYPFDELRIKTGATDTILNSSEYKAFHPCDDDIDLAVVCLDSLLAGDPQIREDLASRALSDRNIVSRTSEIGRAHV